MSRTDLLHEFLVNFNTDNIIGYYINIDRIPSIYMYGRNRGEDDLECENYIVICKTENEDFNVKTGCFYHYLDRDGGYLDDLGYQIQEISSTIVKDISTVAQKILSISSEFLYENTLENEEFADQIGQHYQEYEKNKIWCRKNNVIVEYDNDSKFILFPIYLKKTLVEEYAQAMN